MFIPLGVNDWEAQSENISRVRLRNMYLTENQLSPDGVSRISRPTLAAFNTVGTSPIYGIWRQDGTLDGDWLVVTGESLYRFTPPDTMAFIDNLPGTEFCQFAGTADRVLIVRNSVAYSTDGVTLTTINMPDSHPVGSVACIDSAFLLSVEDSQRFYWINPGGTDPDALDFASAERTPDAIVSINVISDEIWFLGQSSVEVWTPTGNSNSPYQRISGRAYTEGCVDRSTAVAGSYNGYPCLLWTTEKRAVIMAQGSPVKISNESIEKALRESVNFRAWGFRLHRHDFYILTCDEQTFAYDMTKQVWCNWDSFQKQNWRAHLGIQVNETVYAGDSEMGIIWELGEDVSDDGEPVIREVSGFLLHTGKPVQCSSVNVRVNAGWAPDYTQDLILEMRWSDDYGFTWTEYFPASMGNRGNYEYDVTYRSLGLVDRPGREFEFRFSQLARFRIDYATMNEV